MTYTGTVSYAGRNIKWNKAEDASEIASELDNTKDLKCLKLEANTLGVEAAKVIGDALAKHPEFERAHWKDLFTGRLKTEIPQALKHLFSGIRRAEAKLVELDLSDNALGPIGVDGMVDFIKSPSCYSLQELRLNNNGLGIKGGTMLAEALMELAQNAEQNGTPLKLKVFISGRNRLENSGAKIFAKFFSMVKSLEEIAMPQNGIFHEGIAALAASFSLNSALRSINLNDNTFTHKGARAMASELPYMKNLEVINFGDCLLKTEGAILVADAINDEHAKLKELLLDSNEITSKGGIALVEAIRNKPNFTHLMLDGNQFGEDGVDILLEMLREMDKEHVMGTLEDNQEPDSEEEEEGDASDDESDDEEAESDEEDEEISGISPLKRESSVQPIQCTASEFLTQPTAARLLGIVDGPSSLLAEAKTLAEKASSDESYFGDSECLINEYINVFMRVASLSTSTKENVSAAVERCARELVREAFSEAEKNDIVSVATNCLLVHFGLVKSEDKSFKIEWDLRGGVIALTKIAQENLLPAEVKSTLQFFFSRPQLSIDSYHQEKHKLLSSLFKA